MHPCELDPEALLAECAVRHTRRGGPGGQHRNKAATAVVLRHEPTGLIAEANERRDQAVNLGRALFRLRLQLALEVRTVRAAVPSPLWRQRCRNGRVSIAAEHPDFPRLLAEALDVATQTCGDVGPAAQDLGCTPTQLIRVLSLDRRGLAVLNSLRARSGLAPLKSR
jgi:hypothetical protein